MTTKPLKLYDIKTVQTILDRKAKSKHAGLLIADPAERKARQDAFDLATAQMALPSKQNGWDKVTDYVEAERGRATSHTYDVTDVYNICLWAEQYMDRDGIAKKDRVGVVITATSAAPTAKAYKYATKCSTAKIERTASSYRLTLYSTHDRYPGPGGGDKRTITLTEAAKASLIKAAMVGYEEPVKSE